MIAPRHPFIALTTAVLLILVFGTAQGANVTVFSNDLAGWTTAAGVPVTVEDFTDSVTPGLSITFGSTAGVTGCESPGGCISGGKYRDRADDTQVTKPEFTFTPAIRAFGANWNLAIPTGQGTNIKLHLTFADSTEMDVATQIPNTFNEQFFGIVSDTPILKIRFDEGNSGTGVVETFDMDDARFVPFDSSVITTVAADLNFPFGVAVNNGDVFIADQNNNVVKKLSGVVTTIVAGTGEAGYNGDNTPATTAHLSGPMGVAVVNGNLLIADTGNHIVRNVNLSTGIITTVAGVPATHGLAVNGVLAFNPSCGPAPAPPCALLHTPTGVAGDAAGNIYIADSMNHQIRKVIASGVDAGKIVAVAGVAGETGNFDGPVSCGSSECIPARLNNPLGVAVGSVFIANQGSDNVRTVVNGEGGPEVGTVVAGTLNSPHGVAVDSSEGVILYIADTLNHRIQRVAGESVTTVAGTGTPGFSGDNGPATAAQLDTPTGVAVDSTGRFLYIADLKNNRIRRVDFNPPPPEP